MIRRSVGAVMFSLLLLCGVFASRAEASANRTCMYVWWVISDNPIRVCLPFFASE